MDRRQSLKAIGIGALSTSVLVEACKTGDEQQAVATDKPFVTDRQVSELARDKALAADTFFTAAEIATITLLADIIIPTDDRSGSASDAGVPQFIEFIVKDMPEHQLPMRGGLRWVDMYCLKNYNAPFTDCSRQQQIALIDQIAYPAKAQPHMQPGVAFFNRMRNLTASGFFTSKIGIADLGYAGNQPNKWEGVPADIIKQYGLEDVTFG
jgi:gluconate 2-dehydrogenase gamma chain